MQPNMFNLKKKKNEDNERMTSKCHCHNDDEFSTKRKSSISSPPRKPITRSPNDNTPEANSSILHDRINNIYERDTKKTIPSS